MIDHATDATLERLLSGTLGAGEDEVARHLDECEACRDRVAALGPTDSALLEAVRIDDRRHLPYEELEALVRDKLTGDDRRAAEEHLAICQSCAAELEDFRQFAPRLAHPVEGTTTDTARTEWRIMGRLREWLSGLFGSTTPQWAMAAGALALLLAVVLPVLPGDDIDRYQLALARLDDGPLSLDQSRRVRAILDGRALSGQDLLKDGLPVVADLSASLVFPVGQPVLDSTPVLEWTGDDAGPWRVQVTGVGGRLHEESGTVAGTTWRVTVPLERGRSYVWTLDRAEVRLGEALFSVLDAEATALWEDVSDRYADQPLLTGAVAHDLGLTRLARAHYERELHANPDSPVAAELIAQLDGQ